MTMEQVKKYLARIGAEHSSEATAEYLATLQYAHLLTVPYENLDILRKVRIDLNLDAIYKKVVEDHRGGYCFELNKLFGSLLSELGFVVTNYVARYLRGETGIPHRRHQVLRVACKDGSEFLCDVGVGAVIPLLPVPYAFGKESVQENGTYSLRADSTFGVVLTELHEGAWRDVYGFTEEPQLAPDYDYASFWCEFAENSPFNRQEMVSIRKEGNIRCTLDGNIFRVFAPEGVTEKTLTDEEKTETLVSVFGISL